MSSKHKPTSPCHTSPRKATPSSAKVTDASKTKCTSPCLSSPRRSTLSSGKMHELVQGSGVFLFKTQLAVCRTAPSRTSLACRLLRVSFTPAKLAEQRTSKRVSTKYAHLKLLDRRIISTIMAICIQYYFQGQGDSEIWALKRNGPCHDPLSPAPQEQGPD